jgi:hypothetical protein
MPRISFRVLSIFIALAVSALICVSCGESESPTTSQPKLGTTPVATPVPNGASNPSTEAASVGMALCLKQVEWAHFTQTADGVFQGIDPESRSAADFRPYQLRDLSVERTEEIQVSAADRANGISWHGYVYITGIFRNQWSASDSEYHGWKQGVWTEWQDGTTEIELRVVDGKWQRHTDAVGWLQVDSSSGETEGCAPGPGIPLDVIPH